MDDLDGAEDRVKRPILVVDDEEEILFSLRGLLRQEFEVYTAQTGAEAVDLMRRQMLHVVLTDQRMPGMTGVDLLRQAREISPWSVRMVITGYADIKSVIEAINQGQIYRYLTKPWDPDELVGILQQACAEYDRLTARRSLLLDVRDHVTRCQKLAGDAMLQSSGTELLERIERVLAEDEGRGGLSLG